MSKKPFLRTANVVLMLLFFSFAYAQETIRVLAIGNSFSEDAVENYLYQLGKAGNVNLIIGNLYIGGCSLERHWENASTNAAAYDYRKIVDGNKTKTPKTTLKKGLKDEKWDYISFQQVSSNSGRLDTYMPYLSNLFGYVKKQNKNKNSKYMLHQTWAYAQNSTHGGFAHYGYNQKAMYDSIANVSKTIYYEFEDIDFVIPAGTAIQNGRTSEQGDKFCKDGYHLNAVGQFTAACVWYQKITGKRAVDNPYYPEGMSDFEVKMAKTAANNAVYMPFSVLSVSDVVYNN